MEEERQKKIQELKELKEKISLGGGPAKIEKVHKAGKLTARERIDKLIDPGSFVELGLLLGHTQSLPGDGLVCGYGTVDGRMVCIYSQDTTVKGGSIGKWHGYKMYCTVERALDMRVPLVGLHDSPGARLPRLDEIRSGGMGDMLEKSGGSIFYPNTQASGVIPQISAILGSCAGISVYSPALTDFIFMIDKQSHMFITGPLMVKSVMSEEITAEKLGGAATHCQISGVADMRLSSEEECLTKIKELLSYLPSNNEEMPPDAEPDNSMPDTNENLGKLVPMEPKRAYDVRKVIEAIVDHGKYYEIKPEYAGEISVGFCRIKGKAVGMIANNPLYMAGSMTVNSSDKQARFIRFCNCFNIPIVILVDTPAYMPGSAQEHGGIIRHGAKVLYALCEATVPRIAIMLRKAYGGGNLGMGVVPGMGTDFIYCWPTMEMGVLGAEQSVELFYGAEIATAENGEEIRAKRLKEYKDTYANPMYASSSLFHISDVIDPAETRLTIINALNMMAKKKRDKGISKRHGNIPL